jgi:hypothetical protein
MFTVRFTNAKFQTSNVKSNLKLKCQTIWILNFDIPLAFACLREVPPWRDEGRDFDI